MTTTPTRTPSAQAPSTPLNLDLARPGDQLTADDLASAFRFLMDQAEALDADVASAPDVQTQQQIGRLQNDLIEQAAALNAQSIDLLAGEARITAEHIASAVAASRAVIDDVAEIQRKLTVLGAVLVFFGAVATGRGGTVVKSARALKDALDGSGREVPQGVA
jgi:hypothetical protein